MKTRLALLAFFPLLFSPSFQFSVTVAFLAPDLFKKEGDRGRSHIPSKKRNSPKVINYAHVTQLLCVSRQTANIHDFLVQ
jgi:hypothetical protein